MLTVQNKKSTARFQWILVADDLRHRSEKIRKTGIPVLQFLITTEKY